MFETKRLQAVSGVSGGINIGGYDYPCSQWDITLQISGIGLPSVASGNYVDVIPGGHRTCILNAVGTWRSSFNPFLTAHTYLSTYKSIRLQIDEGVDDMDDDSAQLFMPSALITQWMLSDDADGSATFHLQAIGDYTFNDFGGLPA